MIILMIPLDAVCLLCRGRLKVNRLVAVRSLANRSSKNHYEMLRVDKDASTAEIKEAFLKLSKQLHPDRNTGNKAHDDFVKLNEAFSVLKSHDTRRQYDLSIGNRNYNAHSNSGSPSSNVYSAGGSSSSFDGAYNPQAPYSYQFRDLGKNQRRRNENESTSSGGFRTNYRDQPSYTSSATRHARSKVEVPMLVILGGLTVSLFYTLWKVAQFESFKFVPDTSVRRFSGPGADEQYRKFVQASKRVASENREKLSANIRKPKDTSTESRPGVKTLYNRRNDKVKSKTNDL
ncbi:dnaJ homolog subfamily B member 9-like [Symsagittifera roscoffensis]|uniref:dnaJ homolog subfamily B member 9-like n=1 Tax=Symsagittifera roscoffensis TaxID=84072 RepID=UPI00307C8A26